MNLKKDSMDACRIVRIVSWNRDIRIEERGGEGRNGRAITLFVLSIVILSHDLEAQAVELRSSRNSENLYRSVSPISTLFGMTRKNRSGTYVCAGAEGCSGPKKPKQFRKSSVRNVSRALPCPPGPGSVNNFPVTLATLGN